MAIKEETKKTTTTGTKAKGDKAEELHTENPVSEKDEVKQAEQNSNGIQKDK